MVYLAGWVVGVQLHPDSLVLMIHCQIIPRPWGLVSWLHPDHSDLAMTHPVIDASTVCRTMPVSAPSTVSGILSPQSLQQTLENAGMPVFLPEGLYLC